MNRYFRNLKIYRIHSQWPKTEEELSEVLLEAEFKPCGAFSERSGGFEAPVENAGDRLCRKASAAASARALRLCLASALTLP